MDVGVFPVPEVCKPLAGAVLDVVRNTTAGCTRCALGVDPLSAGAGPSFTSSGFE